jgi:hypothetical protein
MGCFPLWTVKATASAKGQPLLCVGGISLRAGPMGLTKTAPNTGSPTISSPFAVPSRDFFTSIVSFSLTRTVQEYVTIIAKNEDLYEALQDTLS